MYDFAVPRPSFGASQITALHLLQWTHIILITSHISYMPYIFISQIVIWFWKLCYQLSHAKKQKIKKVDLSQAHAKKQKIKKVVLSQAHAKKQKIKKVVWVKLMHRNRRLRRLFWVKLMHRNRRLRRLFCVKLMSAEKQKINFIKKVFLSESHERKEIED